jgi:hypothetical protein
MHSASQLTRDSFTITIAGRQAALADVFPGFQRSDRLGVVVRSPCGGVGASALILAAVTGFYEHQRARSDDFFIYPDYFVFHVGRRHGDHNMLNVWPDHKEVTVPDDPEVLLQAINDRGVTRLVVENGVAGQPELGRHTRGSAESRIVSALTYAPHGDLPGGDVEIRGNVVTESYVDDVLDESTMVPAQVREAVRTARRARCPDGAPTETYRRVTLDHAFALLAAGPTR